MLSSWRGLWNQSAESLPVSFVQIGGYSAGGVVSTIRLAQSDTLPEAEQWYSNHSARIPTPNSAVAPSYDLCSPQPGKPQTPGEAGYQCWIHARNKSEVSRRVALQLLSLTPWAMLGGEEFSGPIVVSIKKTPFSAGRSPTVTITMDHAKGISLSPGQGCVQCCNQTADPLRGSRGAAVFEVANRRGVWLPAIGRMTPDGHTVEVVPAGHAGTVANDWLAAVRYAMIDEPQCVLYNSASLPALPLQLPVPWERPA